LYRSDTSLGPITVAATKPVAQRFVAQARAGRLTLRNTRSGSERRRAVQLVRAERHELTRSTAGTAEERSAVNRVEYLARRTARPDLSARQAAGHEALGDVLPIVTFFAELGAGPTLLVDVTVSRRDARRVGRYLSLVAQLTEGRLAPAAFERRVRSWRPVTILDPPGFRGQVRFLADPAAVLALAEVERGEERESWIDSGRRRPSARSRR
jgi:hypothetical protein